MFRNHPLFSRDPTALQLFLYYDEVEPANPLGSKTGKHKLGREASRLCEMYCGNCTLLLLMSILFWTVWFNFVSFILGVVYYTLGNISPKYRSQLDAIQLLAIATSPVIKRYGIDAILEPFLDDLQYLEQVSITAWGWRIISSFFMKK